MLHFNYDGAIASHPKRNRIDKIIECYKLFSNHPVGIEFDIDSNVINQIPSSKYSVNTLINQKSMRWEKNVQQIRFQHIFISWSGQPERYQLNYLSFCCPRGQFSHKMRQQRSGAFERMSISFWTPQSTASERLLIAYARGSSVNKKAEWKKKMPLN